MFKKLKLFYGKPNPPEPRNKENQEEGEVSQSTVPNTKFKKLKLYNGEPNPPKIVRAENREKNITTSEEQSGGEQAKEKDEDLLESMSLEEKLEMLSAKKEEIFSLQDKRRNFYIDARNFEDKMNALGLSDEKRKEIRGQILAEGGEISSEINDIRKAYGFAPTPVEIYSARFKDCEAEVERIKKALVWDYREALKYVDEAIVSATSQNNPNKLFKTLTDSLVYKKYDEKIPEVKEFLENESKDSSDVAIMQKMNSLKDLLNKKIGEDTLYKTPADVNDAKKRMNRVAKIWDNTEVNLRDAMNKEGRFSEVQ